jgi:predicted MPP superfamily phosphohydrolase
MPPPLARAYATFIVLCVIVSSITGLIDGFAEPTLRLVNVPLARLPPELHGFRIAVITDTHIGAAVGGSRLERAVDMLLSAQFDAVALVGDISDGDEALFEPALRPLKRVAAACNATAAASAAARGERRCSGAYYVTGNHEGDNGRALGKLALLGSWGITGLVNQRVPVPAAWPVTTATFDLAGVPDWATSVADGMPHNLPAAVDGRNTSRELVVLAHQPAHAYAAASAGAGLLISGHVHGGQCMPVIPLANIANLYFAGLYVHDKGPTDASNPQPMRVYVSRGTRSSNAAGVPVGCRRLPLEAL